MSDLDRDPPLRRARTPAASDRDGVPGRAAATDGYGRGGHGLSSRAPGKVSSTEGLLADETNLESNIAREIEVKLELAERQLGPLEAALRDRTDAAAGRSWDATGRAWFLSGILDSLSQMFWHADATHDETTRALRPRFDKLIATAQPLILSARDDGSGMPTDAAGRSRGNEGGEPDDRTAMVAERGVQGAGEPLPFREQIQASFGRHDVSNVRAHVGGPAKDASHELGAHAYAMNGRVAFASQPDLFLAAHEAAHVVQQRTGIALKGALDQPGDSYEQGADEVAGMVVRGQSAEALLDNMAGAGGSAASTTSLVQRKASAGSSQTSVSGTAAAKPIERVDVNATTKSNAPQLVTADYYLSLWSNELLDVAFANLGAIAPHPHARLRWTAPDLIREQLRALAQMEIKRFGTDERSLLTRVFYPIDLYAIIDTYRELRPPVPGREADGPIGTSSWQTAIADAIAAEARTRLSESIVRMGQRYVAAADSLDASGVRDVHEIQRRLAGNDALIASTPLDYIVSLALRDAALVTYTPPTAKSPREKAPDKLKPLLVTCMGARDPNLWNVLLVETPGATVDDVANVLFSRGDDGSPHTYNADLITGAAPYYIIPPDWAATIDRIGGQVGPAAYEPIESKKRREAARYNPAAAQREASKEAPDPRTALAESTIADEIALTQNRFETQRETGKNTSDTAATLTADDAVKLIDRGFSQLSYLREVLAPWTLDELVGPAEAFLVRVQERTTRSSVLNAEWSTLLSRHGGLLAQISEDVASFVNEIGAAAKRGDAHSPIGAVLAAYARAAGAAHLVGSGSALLAKAQKARQGVMLATIELALQSSGAAVAQERAHEDQTRHVDANALHLDDTQASLKLRAAQMRNALAQGKSVEAEEAEEFILEAEENRLIATMSSLKVQFHDFKRQADQATLGFLPGIVASSELVNMRADAPFLEGELSKVYDHLQSGHKIIYAERDPKAAKDASLPDIRTRKRQNLRQYIQSTHEKLTALKTEHRVEQFLNRANQVIAEQRFRVMIAETAALIGIGLVTGGVASFVGGVVRGSMLADLGVEAATLISTARRARAIGTAAEIVTDAALGGVAQSAVMGGPSSIGENLVSNALTRFALHPLGRITAGLGPVDKRALDMWHRVGRGTTFVLAHGVQLSAEMVTGAAIGYVVHRIAAAGRGETPSDDLVDSWLLQGVSFAIGRYLNGALAHRTQQLDKLGQRAGRLPHRMRELERRARQVERTGNPDEALDMLVEHHRLVDEEVALISKLEQEGVLRANEASALRDDATEDVSIVKSHGFEQLQLRAAGLEPIVAEAGRWRGTTEEILHTLANAKRLRIDIHVQKVGDRRWHITHDGRLITIEEIERGAPTPRPAARDHIDEARAARLAADARVMQDHFERQALQDLHAEHARRGFVERDSVQAGNASTGVMNQATAYKGGETLLVSEHDGTMSNRGETKLGQKRDSLKGPGLDVDAHTADEGRVKSKHFGEALDVGRVMNQSAAVRGRVTKVEARPDAPDPTWRSDRPWRLTVHTELGDITVYTKTTDWAGGMGPTNWAGAKQIMTDHQLGALRGAGLLIGGDSPGVVSQIKAGAENILVWGGSPTGAWAAEDAVKQRGARHVDLVGGVTGRARDEHIKDIQKYEADKKAGRLDPTAVDPTSDDDARWDQAHSAQDPRGGAHDRNTGEPGAAYNNPRVRVTMDYPLAMTRTKDHKVEVAFSSGQKKIYDQVVTAHGQDANHPDGIGGLIGKGASTRENPNASVPPGTKKLKPVYGADGELVFLETVDPPGFRLKGASYAQPVMAGWIDPSERERFLKAVNRIADTHPTPSSRAGNYHPVSQDSKGVSPGVEGQRERVPRGNELIATREYKLRGPGGGQLDLTGVPHDAWSSRIEVFLTDELRAERGRVRVLPLASDPRGETFAVTVGVETLGRIRITESSAAANAEQQALAFLSKEQLGEIRTAEDRGRVGTGRRREEIAVLTHGGMTMDELALASRSAHTAEDQRVIVQRLEAAAQRAGEALGELHKRYARGHLSASAKESMIVQARTQLLDARVQRELGPGHAAVATQFEEAAARFRSTRVDATAAHGHAETASFGFENYDSTNRTFADVHASNVADLDRNVKGRDAAGEQDVGQFLESLDHIEIDPAQRAQLRERFLKAYGQKRYGGTAPADLSAATQFFEMRSQLDRLVRGDTSVVRALAGTAAPGVTRGHR